MTDLMRADVTAAAQAERAAEAAGVTVRELTGIDEHNEVVRVLSEIWGRGAENPVVPPELLRAFSKAGNYIAGAFAGDALVGATIGFHSTPERHTLHSHIAGVVPAWAGHSVGYAMKLHQRGWALARGIDVIEWTFDPLVARNAYFNIVKLRARPVEYLANFYGEMSDAINGGDDTDRLLVSWSLLDDAVVSAASGHAIRAPRSADLMTVAVPADIERLRIADPSRAREWRRGVREQLVGLLGAGGQIVGFDRAGGYIVQPGEAGTR